MNSIHINSEAQAHINAYLEYRNIVGDADGGKLLSEEEYAEFKRKAVEARKHRLYVSWRPKGSDLECRVIGPLSKCMCDHRYRDHETDTKNKKRVFCRVKGCNCRHFEHVPVRGCQDVKCHCKHSFREHDVRSKVCQRNPCRNACTGFKSSFGCACGLVFSEHHTVYETKEERVAKGLPVENLCGGGKGYAALGGLINFSSLADGVERMRITGDSPNAPEVQHDDNLQFMKPKTKLTEEDELALYASKYNSSSGGNTAAVATTSVSRRPRRRTPKANSGELRELGRQARGPRSNPNAPPASRRPSEAAKKRQNDSASNFNEPVRHQRPRRPSDTRQSLSGASRTKSTMNQNREPVALESRDKFSMPFAVPKPRASLPKQQTNPASRQSIVDRSGNRDGRSYASNSNFEPASDSTRSAIRKDRLSLLKKKRAMVQRHPSGSAKGLE